MREQQLAQRHFIQTAVLAGKSFSNILVDLQHAYGDSSLSRTQVFYWFQQFKHGRTNVYDLGRRGAPVSIRTPENIIAVWTLVRDNPRITQLQIAHSLNISEGSAYRILTEDLRLKRVSAKFVPYALTPQLKSQRLHYCQELVQQMEIRGDL